MGERAYAIAELWQAAREVFELREQMALRIAVNYPWPMQDIFPLTYILEDEARIRQALDDGLALAQGDTDLALRWARNTLCGIGTYIS